MVELVLSRTTGDGARVEVRPCRDAKTLIIESRAVLLLVQKAPLMRRRTMMHRGRYGCARKACSSLVFVCSVRVLLQLSGLTVADYIFGQCGLVH
jgi:hypothetical protein